MPSLDEIKKRAKNGQSENILGVDAQGKIIKVPKGTKVPEGAFYGDPWEILNNLGMTLSAAGGVKLIADMIRLWITQKQGRKIRIKKGDFEIEFQGNYSLKEIEIAIEKIKMLKKDIKSEEITIIGVETE